MTESRMLDLKSKLSPESEDENRLFYFFYYLLLFSKKNDAINLDRKIKALESSRVDKLYFLYVKFARLFFNKKKSCLYVNVGKFSDALRNQRKDSFFLRVLSYFLLDKVDVRRFFKAYWGCQVVKDYLLEFQRKPVDVVWEKSKKDEELINQISKVSRDIHDLLSDWEVSSIVVVDFNDPVALFFVTEANKLGVEVVTIPHGYIQDYTQLYDFLHVSNFYLAWSRSEAKDINKIDCNTKALYAGCPLYSKKDVQAFGLKWVESFKKRKKKCVCFFANPLSGRADFDAVVNFLERVDVYCRSSNIDFFVKLHQRDKIDEVSNALSSFKINIRMDVAEKLIEVSDLVLGFQTTVLYQARILGVKACQVDLNNCREKLFTFDGVEVVSVPNGTLGDRLVELIDKGTAFSDIQNEGLNSDFIDDIVLNNGNG